MKKSKLMTLWGLLFVLCAGLGFVPDPGGAVKGLLTFVSVLFFVPPFLLLRQARSRKDRYTITLVRNLSALSLLLTVLLLAGNFLSVVAGEWVGTMLYYTLVIISSPMICSGHWAMSLFLWACLLFASLKQK